MSQTAFTVTEAYPSTAGMTASERHRLLEDDHRRLALEILAQEYDVVSLRHLADEIAARKGAEGDEEVRKEIGIELHHVHLPKLTECGALEYDPDTHEIRR